MAGFNAGEDEDLLHEVLEGETLGLPEADDEDAEDELIENEDGSAVIRLKDNKDLKQQYKHFANIVEDVSASDLNGVVTDLLEKLERDKEARKKRDKLYEEGLRRTGLGDDAPGGAQFAGANKVVHPMLVEACVDFSARAMKELFPPSGPVKSKLVGNPDKQKVEKAERKAAFMNWQLTEQIEEFRGELEQLTTQLPLGGAQYLKVLRDTNRKRPSVEFVAIDDILLPFAATNFYTAERKTHVQFLTRASYAARVKSGMYIDADVSIPVDPEFSAASKANDAIEGRAPTSYNEDGLRKVFEVSVHLDIEDEGDMRPYILTIDETSQQALSLYRNWDLDDESCTALDWIVEFPFVPWRGAYPIGLTHMIGGLSGAATGALRALLDSAHIQNMPTLLKLKGGPDGQTLNMQPTEVVEVDGGSLVDDIRKLVMAVPFNGPSPVLYQLLGFLVDAGKGVVQTSFEKLSDGNPNTPVGTTLALIEQGMVVFSSIHSRLHASMGRVLKIVHRLNASYLTEEDIKRQCGDMEVQPSDFDGPMDVIPVSDPQIFSETQRFAQTQAIMQRSAVMPQLYDQRKVEEMFLRSMKVQDDILQPKIGDDDLDPVSENVAAAMGRPIYVLPRQDHIAHLRAHMAFLSSPVFGANPAIQKTYIYPMSSHLRDHLLNYYLVETHKGVRMAEQGEMIEEGDASEQVKVIAAVQLQIEKELTGFAQMLPGIDQHAQQFAPRPPMPPDNSIQVAQMNLQARQQDSQMRQQTDAQRIELDKAKLQQAPQLEQFKQSQENARTQAELSSRERINMADNETAMRLAAAEIQSGEKIAVSTGTGINPGA